MLDYPDSPPMESIRYLASAIPSRTFDTKVFAKHLWLVQGYAQKMLIGDPALRVLGNIPSDEEARTALQELELGVMQGPGSMALSIVLRWALNRLITLL